jgi:transcriptional regulator with XRE-family HTH domain
VCFLKRQILINFRGQRKQTEMASIYGVSQQLWSCWENGFSTPLPHIMKKLENDIGVPMEDIFPDVFNLDIKDDKSLAQVKEND